MSDEPKRTDRKYDVALSFAGEEREYVEAVASSLRDAGVSVFYDRYEEASLWGKDLYEHLNQVYTKEAHYTVLFASKAYAKKLWTNHERKSAQARAFEEQTEYILPARFDDTPIPGLPNTTGHINLQGKNPEELAALIIQKLGLRNQGQPSGAPFSLQDNPLFAAAMAEVKLHGSASYAITDAIIEQATPPEGLAEFLQYLVTESEGFARLSLGKFAINCVDRFDIGREAVDYCLGENALTEDQRELLGLHLQHVARDDVVRWAHERLTGDIRSDTYYYSFLEKHLSFVLQNLAGEMTAYLLVPDRGPVNYNIDSLMLLAKHSEGPGAFVRRIREWIQNGNFDGEERERNPGIVGIETARLLYTCLNEIAELSPDHPLQILRTEACDRTRRMLASSKDLHLGLYHLFFMRLEGYVDVESMLERVYDCPRTADADTWLLFEKLKNGGDKHSLAEARALAESLGLV